MVVFRMIDPGREALDEVIDRAVERANEREIEGRRLWAFDDVRKSYELSGPVQIRIEPSERPLTCPEGWVDQILETPEGLEIAHGGIVRYQSDTSAMLAAWWTGFDGAKYVLVAGAVVGLERRSSSKSTLEQIAGRVRPRDVIRGYRYTTTRELVGALSRKPFEWLSRMPAVDSTRESLELAALYGDPAAQDALKDYIAERGGR